MRRFRCQGLNAVNLLGLLPRSSGKYLFYAQFVVASRLRGFLLRKDMVCSKASLFFPFLHVLQGDLPCRPFVRLKPCARPLCRAVNILPNFGKAGARMNSNLSPIAPTTSSMFARSRSTVQ